MGKIGACNGVNRRHLLRIGGSGWLGGLGLSSLLQLQGEAATRSPGKATSLIFLFLEGGPSTIDMWDLKPDAPAEVRGPYRPIKTNVPGIEVGEHCVQCAKTAHRYAILRSHGHSDNGHQTGNHFLLTGYRPEFQDGQGAQVPNNILYPSLGAMVQRELGPRGGVPPQVNLPNQLNAGGPGFYGAEYAPFVIENDPVQADFEVKDVVEVEGIGSDRFERRRRALGQLEAPNGSVGRRSRAMSRYYQKAYDLITSSEARKAFDIHREPAKVREQYGYTSLGQCALLARRLVEAGCRFVGVDHGSWDTHYSCFPSLQNDLIPHADRAFAALVTDLDQRGLLDSTLVVMMGEMGRTPKINKEAGRDHWSMAQSVLLAGGGIRGGQVVGATDAEAAYPTTEPVGVNDLLRTLLGQLGINADRTYLTPLGRPVPLVNGGRVVRELV